MDRRRFLLTSLAGTLAAPLVAEGQQAEKVRRIGMLITFSPQHPMGRRLLDAFRQGLREIGYVEGQNLVIESRSAHGDVARVERLLAELEGLRVAVIFLQGGTPAAQAARRAHISTPIVAPAMADPVRDGVIVSLARPGGNITGSTFLGPGLVPKRVELIREALPRVVRVAALWHPTAYGEGTMSDMVHEAQATAQALKIRLQLLEARRPDDFEPAFSAMSREHTGAVIVFPSVMFFEHHTQIVAPRQEARASGHLRLPGGRRGRWPDVVWGEPS